MHLRVYSKVEVLCTLQYSHGVTFVYEVETVNDGYITVTLEVAWSDLRETPCSVEQKEIVWGVKAVFVLKV